MLKQIKNFLKQIFPPPVKTFLREIERIFAAAQTQSNLLHQLVAREEVLSQRLQAMEDALVALEQRQSERLERSTALLQETLTNTVQTLEQRQSEQLERETVLLQEKLTNTVQSLEQRQSEQLERETALLQENLTDTVQLLEQRQSKQLHTTHEKLVSSLMQELSCAQKKSLVQLDALRKNLYVDMKEREERLRRKDPFEHPPKLPEISQREIRNWVDEQDAEIPEGFERVIPVVFAANDNYAAYAGVAIESLLKNAGNKNFYRIYILHSGLSRYHMETLELTRSNQASVQCVDVSKQIKVKEAELYERAFFTKEMYYRFLIADLFHFYDFVIYLDCDLVVCTDIADIIPEDMGDALIAGVLNPSGKENARIRKEKLGINAEEYINTGVLVFNLQQWKKEEVAATCFQVLSEAPKEYLWCPDQDILNIVCAGRIFFLESNWNFMWHMVYGSPEYVEICTPITAHVGNTFKILHFASEMKPWEIPQVALSSCFWKYARMSCFYEEILSGKFL